MRNLLIRKKEIHPLQWIAELLENQPGFHQRKMFGCEALRLDERLMLVLAAGEEPWNGLMICTSREHHPSLMQAFPALEPHAILGKWLYVSQSHEGFEEIANKIAKLILRSDPRIGIDPKPKVKPKSKNRTSRGKKKE